MAHTNSILLFRALQKFALNINKEIIRLAVSYLKASERFVQPLFWPTKFVFIFSFYLFICYSFMSYCTGLTVSDYILLEFSVLFHSVFGIIFYIYCFIVSFIVSAWRSKLECHENLGVSNLGKGIQVTASELLLDESWSKTDDENHSFENKMDLFQSSFNK